MLNYPFVQEEVGSSSILIRIQTLWLCYIHSNNKLHKHNYKIFPNSSPDGGRGGEGWNMKKHQILENVR